MGEIEKPPHHNLQVDAGLGDPGGYFPSRESADSYASESVTNLYGLNRVRSIRNLLDQVELPLNPVVVDFGGGDGVFLGQLELDPSSIHIVDVSQHMLDIAAARAAEAHSNPELSLHLGSVECLEDINDSSTDLFLCIDVFGYLLEQEQARLIREVRRILRSGGVFVVNVGNELLDLFALNSGTTEFFRINFGADVSSVLTVADGPRWAHSRRANPLNFGSMLASFGLTEVAQSFSHWHVSPPGVSVLEAGGDLAEGRLASRDESFDAQALPDESRWQALFRCSTFASLSRKSE